MTQKAINEVYLTECTDCQGSGYITVGAYDQEDVIECICKKMERQAKEESLAE